MSHVIKTPEGYKVTSIGLIPIEWEITKIASVGKITSGTTPLRSEEKYHSNGSIHWVKTTDLNNSTIEETEEKITKIALTETSLRLYPKGTVLVAMYGGFNQIGRTGILGIEATINQALSAITVNREVTNPKYLQYWLNLKVGLWKNLAGSSRKDPNITSKDVGYFPFINIPLLEQTNIVEVLQSMDKALCTLELILSAKETRKLWIVQQLLSGKKRLKGFDSEVEHHTLRHYIKEISDRNKSMLITRVLSVTNSRGFINQSDHFDRVIASNDLSNYKVVKKGEFAYNPSRINVGSLDLLQDFEIGILSPMYVVFKTNNRLLPIFLYYHLKSRRFNDHIPMFVQGSVRDSLSYEGLSGMKFFIPSIEEQHAIVKVLQTADQEIQLLRTKIKKLKQVKRGTMQLLLTGKKRIKIN